MKKLNIIDWGKIILVIIILVFIGVYFYQKGNVSKFSSSSTSTNAVTTNKNISTTKTTSVASKTASKCNFKIISPNIGSSVTFPLTVKGILDKLDTKEGCDWRQNLNQAGTAEIFYNRNGEGWKSPGIAVPIIASTIPGLATTTLSLTTSLNVYTQAIGLNSGTPIKIVLTELNIQPDVSANPDTFSFIVYLK